MRFIRRYRAIILASIITSIVIAGFLLAYYFKTLPLSNPAIPIATSSNPVEPQSSSTSQPTLASQVKVSTPAKGEKITSPLAVTGSAPGPWFFEASFPVAIEDERGVVLGTGIAQAQSDWMTTDLVPFSASITFTTAGATSGFLVLRRDNPSGDPRFDAQVKIPVVFGKKIELPCRPTGCSGQLCADSDIPTTCIYREYYGCYQKAQCKRLPDGQCGWTGGNDFISCLQQFGAPGQ